MRIFVTGASGFIGRHLVPKLLSAGHQVAGLARSDDAAKRTSAAGIDVQRGDIADAEALRSGVSGADAAIHLAFDADFSKFAESSAIDRHAIETIGAAFAGTPKRLIVPTGLAGVAPPSRLVTEAERAPSKPRIPRVSEQATLALAEQGVNACLIRLAQIHGPEKQGFVSRLIAIARAKGVSGYVGDGGNRWPAAHIDDTARLFRLVLERGTAGGIYHAVAEEGVALRSIAEHIGRLVGVPVRAVPDAEVREHFGPMAPFIGMDMPASSAVTRASLDWQPDGCTLTETLDRLGQA